MSESDRPDDDEPYPDDFRVIRAEFDWTAVTPSAAVIESLAIAIDREPTARKPLYETIDPDALDSLIRSGRTHSTDGTTTVTFALDGHGVTVRSDGTVVVRSLALRSESEWWRRT